MGPAVVWSWVTMLRTPGIWRTSSSAADSGAGVGLATLKGTTVNKQRAGRMNLERNILLLRSRSARRLLCGSWGEGFDITDDL